MTTTKEQKACIWLFIGYLSLSFLLYSLNSIDGLQKIAFLKYVFKPIEVFFHESSHLLMALAMGSSDIDLVLAWDSGHISHRSTDFARPFISFVGYFGASLFGFMIYCSTLFSSKYLKIFLIIYTAFFFLFASTTLTFILLGMILGIFVLSWKFMKVGHYLIQFIGVYIMVASVYSPTYLWAYSDSGDHVSLSDALLIPSFVWIGIWFGLGLFFIYKSFKLTLSMDTD
jgi:hypothetical protein